MFKLLSRHQCDCASSCHATNAIVQALVTLSMRVSVQAFVTLLTNVTVQAIVTLQVSNKSMYVINMLSFVLLNCYSLLLLKEEECKRHI